MNKLKVITIVTTIGCLLFLLYLSFLFPQVTHNYNVSSKSFCNVIADKSVRDLCISFEIDCKKTNPKDPINCIAGMLAQANEIKAAKQICSLKEGTILQQFCSAISLALIDPQKGLAECDSINDIEKYHCQADVWKEAKNLEQALKECDTIKIINQTDTDSFYKCKASVYRAINISEALEYCEKINNTEMKEDCKNFVTA
jgi:hypothetical protein